MPSICLHIVVMRTVVITIRDVPQEVRDQLAEDARSRGQSLQAYLLSVLCRQAAFGRNRSLLAEIEADLGRMGGAGSAAPDSADVLAAERAAHSRPARGKASRRTAS